MLIIMIMYILHYVPSMYTTLIDGTLPTLLVRLHTYVACTLLHIVPINTPCALVTGIQSTIDL